MTEVGLIFSTPKEEEEAYQAGYRPKAYDGGAVTFKIEDESGRVSLTRIQKTICRIFGIPLPRVASPGTICAIGAYTQEYSDRKEKYFGDEKMATGFGSEFTLIFGKEALG